MTDSRIARDSAAVQQQPQEGALALFADSFKHAVAMPAAGTRQLLGKDTANRQFFGAQDKSNLGSLGKVGVEAGNMLGTAAVFMGANALLKRIPVVGEFSAPVTGAVLGFLEPTAQGEGLGVRAANAGVGAATLSIMELGCRTLPSFGIKNECLSGLAKTGVSGFAAGAVNAQAESLIHEHKPANLGETMIGAGSWAATGAAFHAVGLGMNKMFPLGIGRPGQGEVYMVGSRFDDGSFRVRDFLQKNHVPFKVYDPEKNLFARRVLNSTPGADSKSGVLILPSGRRLVCPEPLELAKELGMKTQPSQPAYDTVVVGAGPAGVQSAIYATSEGLRTLLVDPQGPGGQAGTTSRVENVMGWQNGVSGPELTGRGFAQAQRLGTEFVLNGVNGVNRLPDGTIRVALRDGTSVMARSVVMATGVQFNELPGVPNAADLTNRGVYYGAALTEAPLVKSGENIYVVGGANSAGQAAVKFSSLVGDRGKVVILARSPLQKSMSNYLIDQIKARPNIEVQTGAQVSRVDGSGKLETVSFTDKGGQEQTRPANSMFVFIGSAPKTDWLPPEIARDSKGFITSGPAAKGAGNWSLEREPLPHETSIPGIFTAGDVHSGTPKRIVTAQGDGATAVSEIHQYLSTKESAPPLPGTAPIAADMAPKPHATMPELWPGYGTVPTIFGIASAWGQHDKDPILPLLGQLRPKRVVSS